MITEFISSTFSCNFSSKSMIYCQVHFYVTKMHYYYITFVAFTTNSVISIILWFCPVLIIHLFTPIEGPITQQNIHGGLCGPDGLDF